MRWRIDGDNGAAAWCALAITVGPWPGAVARADEPALLPAAASDRHAWLIVEVEQPVRGFQVVHHAADSNGPFIESPPADLILSQRPQALAAWERDVWIACAPDHTGSEQLRNVFTLTAEPHPVLGGFVFAPYDRFGVAPPLPGRGRLASLAAGADGLWALLVPARTTASTVQPRDPAAEPDQDLAQPALLALSEGVWIERPFPSMPMDAADWRMTTGPGDGRTLWLIGTPRERSKLIVWFRDHEGSWSRHDWSGPAPDLLGLARAGGRPVIVARNPGDANLIDLAYLRESGPLPFATVARPEGDWSALGLRDGVRLIEHTRLHGLRQRAVDPLSGEAGPWVALEPRPRGLARVIHWPLLLTAAMAAMITVFVFRPSSAQPIALPAGTALMGPMPRLIALIIDLAPGAGLAMLLTRCEFGELFRVASLAPTIEQAVPSSLMIAVTLAHSAFGEMCFGRSLGKGVLGARVARDDGSRPSWRQIAIRNALKALVMLVPVLALIGLAHPLRKGLGDHAARTIVVVDQPADDRKD